MNELYVDNLYSQPNQMFNPCCQDNTVVRNEDYYLYRGNTNNRHGRVEVRESRLNSIMQESS